MRNSALNDKRSQRILADVVRTYIETGEPVSSRAISHRHADSPSSATIRNVMADLEVEGYLYQPHTSAGRVPTASAFRFYVQEFAGQAQLSPEDQTWVRNELAAARTPEEVMERASHVLATVSRGLGIVVSPPLSRTVLEHIRFVLLPDGRVVVVLVSNGGLTRDKVVRVDQQFAQEELDRTAEHLNRHYVGWTLDAIRTDLAARVQRDRERYDRLVRNALTLCDPALLETSGAPQVYLEGAAQIATAPEFAGQEELRELLGAIEEKTRLVALLTGCVEDPEPVHVQIGVAELSGAGQYLSLISAPYACNDYLQGSLGVLGPIRMHYERAITVVAHVARIFGDNLHRSGA